MGVDDEEPGAPYQDAIRCAFQFAREHGRGCGPAEFLVGISEGSGPAAAVLDPAPGRPLRAVAAAAGRPGPGPYCAGGRITCPWAGSAGPEICRRYRTWSERPPGGWPGSSALTTTSATPCSGSTTSRSPALLLVPGPTCPGPARAPGAGPSPGWRHGAAARTAGRRSVTSRPAGLPGSATAAWACVTAGSGSGPPSTTAAAPSPRCSVHVRRRGGWSSAASPDRRSGGEPILAPTRAPCAAGALMIVDHYLPLAGGDPR
jgi:hypothetical protein